MTHRFLHWAVSTALSGIAAFVDRNAHKKLEGTLG